MIPTTVVPGSRVAPPLRAMVAVLALAACSSPTSSVATLWEGTLTPSVPGGIQGSVAAVGQFGRTLLSIEIRMAESNAAYGWRVQSGTCQTPGLIQGGEAVYPPLDTGEGGTATADAVVAGVFRRGSSYSASVFRNAQSGGEELLACGNLQEKQ